MGWLIVPAVVSGLLSYYKPPGAAPPQEEPAQPGLIVWVCLGCSRAFGEQDKALDHHTKRKHRLSKRRVE